MASSSVNDLPTDSSKNDTEFVKVTRKSRKRKLDDTASAMDTTEKLHSDVKRPSFPPISADKMTVCFDCAFVANS